jgi:FkbM family methyltransferase
MIEPEDDRQLIKLLRAAESSLKTVVDANFVKANEHLSERYSDEDILEVFRLCLVKPGGGSWSPVWQALLLLFQAAFSDSYTSAPQRFARLGNYLIHKVPFGTRPVVYSFGIGSDISFDKAAADCFAVPIYMYDPTPGVVTFMEGHRDDDRLKFTNEGIYSSETTTKLYTSSKPGKLNSSLYPIHGPDGGFEIIKCRTLDSFMADNAHDAIDILKMDVEGVADDVLNQIMDETDIRPRQIITEFEIKGIENPITYLPRILALMQKLKANDYLIFNQLLTRKASIELIIVHRTLWQEYSEAISGGVAGIPGEEQREDHATQASQVR